VPDAGAGIGAPRETPRALASRLRGILDGGAAGHVRRTCYERFESV
jgi:hypothetical protein